LVFPVRLRPPRLKGAFKAGADFLVCLFLLAASCLGRAQQRSYLSRRKRICQIRKTWFVIPL